MTVRASLQGATFSMRGQLVPQTLFQPFSNGRAKGKVMRKRDCLPNLDTPLVCARRHRQMTMKCAYLGAERQCSVPRHTVRHFMRASHGLVDVKLYKQIIRNPPFKRENKLVTMQLNNNSKYLAISKQLVRQQYQQSWYCCLIV